MKHEISLVRLVNPAIDGSFSVAGSLVVVVLLSDFLLLDKRVPCFKKRGNFER